MKTLRIHYCALYLNDMDATVKYLLTELTQLI